MGYDVARLRLEVDSSGLVKGTQEMSRFEAQSTRTGAAAANATKLMRGLAAAAVAVGAGAAFGQAVQRSHDLEKALTEVSTLIEGTPAQMKALEVETIRLSKAYGGELTTNAQGFYQAISAGAVSIEEASRVVEQANKLAIGGMTDVATGVDGLTSAVNAFRESGLTAAEASDAMFVGMREGKTTIAELAGSLGRVAPIAAQVGLSFDEMIAAIAATTKGGIGTNEAVSGLKAALSNIITPSEQAKVTAKQLGIEFNVAALEAKGLAGFMGDLRDATGGNAQTMAQLFGSVEGLAVAASLAGAGFEDLTGTLDGMERKLGETDAAMSKVADSLPHRLQVAVAALKAASLDIGKSGLGLQVFVTETAAAALTAFSDTLAQFDAAGLNMSAFAETAKTKFTEIGAAFGNMVNLVRGIVQGEWYQAWTAAEGIVSASSTSIVGRMQGLANKIGASFVEAIRSVGADAEEQAEQLAMRMADGFHAGRDEYLRMMEDARVKANEFYAAIGSQAVQVGQSASEGIVEAAAEISVGFEMAKSNLVQVTDEATDTSGALDGAAASADKLASALGVAVSDARALSTYADGTNFTAPTAANGYAGTTSNWFNVGNTPSYTTFMGEQKINFDLSAIDDQVSALESLRNAASTTSRSLSDDSREIARALDDITGAIGNYSPENLKNALTAGADKPGFWDSFKSLAISSWTEVMSQSFSPGGAAMNAVSAGLAQALGDVLAVNVGRVGDALASIPETFDVKVYYGAGVDRYTFPVTEGGGIYNKFYNDAFGNLKMDELTDYGLKGVIGKNTKIREFWEITTKKVQEEINDEMEGVVEDATNALNSGDDDIWRRPTIDDMMDNGGAMLSTRNLSGAKYVSPDERDIVRRYDKQSKQLTRIVGNIAGDIRDTVRVFSDSIGGASDRINKVTLKFRGSIGTGDDAIDKAKDLLVSGIEDYSEKLAKAVLKGQSGIRMAGEKWTEALERIAKDYWGIVNTMEMLGGQTFKNNIKGANYASQLVQQFGSTEDFATAATGFFGVAYSGEEQQAQLKSYAKDIFKSLGLDPKDLPKSREAYKNLVLSLDLETKIGRERYATLVNMSGLFDQILPAFDAVGDATNEAADGSERYSKAMARVAGDLSGMVSEAGSASARFKELSKSLAGTADDLRGLGRTSEQTLEVLRTQYEATLARSMKGNADAMAALGGLSTEYAEAAKSSFSTAAEYRFFTSRLASQVDKVSDVAKDEAKMSRYEEKSLQALLDAVNNGELNNKLVTKTNEAVGGLSNKMLRSLNQIYKYETGDNLDIFEQTKEAWKKTVVEADANKRTAPEVKTATNGDDDTGNNTRDRSGDTVRSLMRKEIREIKRGNKWEKRAYKVLKNWDGDGLPAERAS